MYAPTARPVEYVQVHGPVPDGAAAPVQALDRARRGDGPSLIEALTYRHGGHSRGDPGKYRPDEELAEWLSRDPIPALRRRLEADGVDAAELDDIDRGVQAEVDAATDAARAAPEPGPEVLLTQVWSDGGSSWRN